MPLGTPRRVLGHALGLFLAGAGSAAWAASPSASDALQLTPVQRDIDYDRPGGNEAAACTIKAEQEGKQTGWVVRSGSGQTLRKFVDTNGDNVVDLWCYYADGVEVYRDIDQNFNGKADQYRWLNTAGTRWGLDTNEDGKIDTWKIISAEETSAELVRAVADRDVARFTRLLITADELGSLGLGSAQEQAISAKVKDATTKFNTFLASRRPATTVQQTSESKPKWVHFGGSLPGMIPAGTAGSTRDITVYENVMAMVQTGDKHGQVAVGTMIQVGSGWRLIDAPSAAAEGQELAGSFFFPAMGKAGDVPVAGEGGGNSKLQGMMAELEKLDAQLARTQAPAELASLNAKRTDLVEQIADGSTGDDRGLWIRQLADTVSAAAQSGDYPDGVKRLAQLKDKLGREKADEELAAYVEFRMLMTEYGVSVRTEKDFVSIQKKWLDSLQKFVEAHPKSPDTAEALLQLGIAQEFAGQEDDAKKWYTKLVENFPRSPASVKAEGARNRLNCVGKTIQLHGTTADGRTLDLSQYRGRIVLIQYWSTDCEPCKADMAQLKDLSAKYKRDGFEIIGVNLDNQKADLQAFLKANKYPWPQVWEQGGLDSSLANSMGILTLPTMILLDKQGKVVNRSIHITEVDREVGALVR